MWRRRPPNRLTPREREVLELIRRGLTNEEIAKRLDISVAGAKYHVSAILSKLGVNTREEAASLSGDERQRWWAGWPWWVRIASAGTVAATSATVVLGSTLIESRWEEQLSAMPGSAQSSQGCTETVTEGAAVITRDVDCETREPTGRWEMTKTETGIQWHSLECDTAVVDERGRQIDHYFVDCDPGERLGELD